MLNNLLSITCCWSIFYALYWVFFRRETFFRLNRFYLLGTLFLGMILPFLNFTFINENSPIAATNYLKTVTIGVENLATTIVVTPESIGSDFQWNWLLILKGIYGVGVAFFSIKFLFGLWIIFDLYKNSNKTQYADYQLIENKKIRIPFSFFQLLFWNNDLNKADPDHQKILQHELAHIRQFHSVDVVILELLSIAFWWNPVVWFYKKSLRTVHEYLADDAVLQTTQKKQYGQLLIRQSHSGMQIALANNFIQSQLKNRIMMMMKSKSKSQQLWKYLLFLPVFGLLFMAFSCENAKAQSESKTAEANLSNPDDDVFKVVEEMPRFAGTDVVNLKDEESRRVASNKLLIEYIIDQIKYPESAKKTGIEGISVVNFIVNKTGRLTDVKIMRSLSPDIDAEAIRVVENMPDWIPGRQQGKLVNVSYNLPIKFKLDGDEPSTGGIHESNLSKKTSLEDVDTKPYFPGCEDLTGEEKENCSNQKLLQFVYTNIKYPKEAQKEEAEGMVVVKFVVAKNGKIELPKVIKSVHPLCDAEVLRIVNEMPNWTPAQKDGKAVAVEFTLPVKFKLEGEKSEKNTTANQLDIRNFKAFPNPASDKLTIQFETAEEIVDVKITDANGRIFLNESFFNLEKKESDWKSKEVDVSIAARGMLLIQMQNEKGNKVRTEKVILH